jgi:hypothetical protein
MFNSTIFLLQVIFQLEKIYKPVYHFSGCVKNMVITKMTNTKKAENPCGTVPNAEKGMLSSNLRTKLSEQKKFFQT